MVRCSYLIVLLLLTINPAMAADFGVEKTSQPQSLQYKLAETEKKANELTNTDATVNKEDQTNYATVRLSPQIRSEENTNNKYTINLENILPHLKNSLVFRLATEFKNLPMVYKYIDDNLIGAEGNQFFAHGLGGQSNSIYTVLRQQNTFIHPDTQENLGTEFVTIGTAKVAERGKDLTKMEIIQSEYAIEKGDKLIPRIDLDLPAILNGKVPSTAMRGYILAVEDGLWDMGKYNSIIISLGKRDGVEQGHVLNVFRMSYRKDLLPEKKYKRKRKDKKQENSEFAAAQYGEVMVYKVFDKVSLGIVLNAKFSINILDVVKSEVVESEECPT